MIINRVLAPSNSPGKAVLMMPWQAAVSLACGCAVLGVFSLYSTVAWLLVVWRTDDLKSMGMLVPFISFSLILRAWRDVGWTLQGTWWGLAILLGALLAVFFRDQTTIVLIVGKTWLLQLPPVPLLAVLYALALVLLFGGGPLLRAAWFPVLFMGAVLPVPEIFSRKVDLPLQHASATVARGFAHLLGEPLTPDSLRLMFTPEFGMFIAPGCNGIRGAVALGMCAIVIAYVYRFRWSLFAPAVIGALLLGYLFNFLRLCLLVVYYRIALPYPWMQERAKGADYLIGGALFALAAYLFFVIADRVRLRPGELGPGFRAAASLHMAQAALPLMLKVAAVVLVTLVFGLDELRDARAESLHAPLLPAMPATLGRWSLTRTYQDTLSTGAVVYLWADYRKPGGAETVSVGVAPELKAHDVEVCHLARGEKPVWHGTIASSMEPGTGRQAVFTAAMYNDGFAQTLEASTVCETDGCQEYTHSAGSMNFVYAHPRRLMPLASDVARSVPVLLKVSTGELAVRPEIAEAQLESELREFVTGADLRGLAAHFRVTATGR